MSVYVVRVQKSLFGVTDRDVIVYSLFDCIGRLVFEMYVDVVVG